MRGALVPPHPILNPHRHMHGKSQSSKGWVRWWQGRNVRKYAWFREGEGKAQLLLLQSEPYHARRPKCSDPRREWTSSAAFSTSTHDPSSASESTQIKWLQAIQKGITHREVSNHLLLLQEIATWLITVWVCVITLSCRWKHTVQQVKEGIEGG